MFDFKAQLEFGDRGEELFIENYPKDRGTLEIYPGREYDFTRSDGKKVELKTDSYNIHKTENFFFERYSDINKQDKPGGPWRAYEDQVDIFYYMFVRHNICFEFNISKEFIDAINKYTEKKGLVYIKNKGWITGGYKVPRKIVEQYYTAFSFKTEAVDGIQELIKLLGGSK